MVISLHYFHHALFTMPFLPSSLPSVSSFSPSPSGIAAVVFFVVVLGGCGVYFAAVPFLRRTMEERRVKVTDSEVRAAPFLVVYVRVSDVLPCRRCSTPLLSRARFQKCVAHFLLSFTRLTSVRIGQEGRRCPRAGSR
jgi:hypothetical protein